MIFGAEVQKPNIVKMLKTFCWRRYNNHSLFQDTFFLFDDVAEEIKVIHGSKHFFNLHVVSNSHVIIIITIKEWVDKYDSASNDILGVVQNIYDTCQTQNNVTMNRELKHIR